MLSWAVVLLALTMVAMATSPRRTALLDDAEVLATRDDSYRLPETIVPVHYDLQLHPNLEGDFRFNGTVAITLRADHPTVNITFHTSDIDVVEDSVSVTAISKAESALKVTAQTGDEERSFYTVTLDSPLAAKEEYILKMDYHGYHRTTTRGFYRSSYLDRNNNTVWLATTHFEPIGARKAFPCFDEPALKATFNISIAAPKGLHAISNMPASSTELE
ncbi:hypothetical protein PR048_008805 [Dryococelus australis]|uniref:Aminopeptidase N-like N-terminal domain-containing protein n=1 Tax=Dryococelus australis TaxID=614101 RepID=A0ABQ9HY53_9NEOP|nr:hypothetical protein PR048_008805 [Dryococelus australis]